ncbi:MAG: ABC transporter substrate-binding protein, partial [Ignisphaera sp.]
MVDIYPRNAKKFTTPLVLLLVSAMVVSFIPIPVVWTQVPELPREQTAIISQSWAVPKGFNPFPAVIAWGATFMQYPYLFVYSVYTDDYVPYLANSFRWVDPYTIEIKLKPDAYWWDKKPITADDVKFTFEIHKNCTTTLSYLWMYLERVEAADPITVIIHLNKTSLNYYRAIEVLQFMVVPRHRWEPLIKQMGCKAITEFEDREPKEIIGGGPYRALFLAGDTWAYERVDDWWGVKYFGLPEPKYVMHIVPKSDEQVRMEWLAGNRDHMSHFVDRLWEIIKADPRFGTFDNVNCPPCYFRHQVAFFVMNMKRKPFDDIRVRKAIYYALLADNMKAIKMGSEMGFSGYLLGPVLYPVPIVPGHIRSEKYLARDLMDAFMKGATIENARRLLDEAGIIDRNGDGIRELPDGRPFKFSILCVTGWVPTIGSAQIWADYLRETLGIDVTVVTKDYTVVFNDVVEGNFDAVWWFMNSAITPASPWINFASTMDPRLPPTVVSAARARYNNTAVIPILEEIARTWEESRRVELYRKLQEIWYQDLPMLALGQGIHWYEYQEIYWVGWPNKERIEKYGAFYATNWEPGFVFVLFQIKPATKAKPDTDTVPEFLKPHNRIPAMKFFEDLEKIALKPTPTPS